jgi:prephenate dehydrogenase
MPADVHDRAAALVSHVPHVLAHVLVRCLAGRPDAQPLAAEGWRRFTAGAGADPAIWSDILATNGDSIAEELDVLSDVLASESRRLRATSQAG